jgi:hypothetical protein
VTRSRRSRRGVAFAVALLFCSTGCGYNGLNFVADERVEITAPPDRAKVALPVTITWDVRDFRVTGDDRSARPDAGYFGVYIDRAPQPPGRTQKWLVRNDPRCKATPASCDANYLAGLRVHSTTAPTFVITRLQEPSQRGQRRREFHEATIVLLNGRGERIGESAFVRQFEVDRGS